MEPLTEKTIEEALNLVNRVFPEEEEEPANLGFPASLDPEKYKDYLSKIKISELRYWVAISDSGKVVGTTGLHCYESDKDEASWLGWFCVHPLSRRQGIGTKLLLFSIEKAKQQGKKFLRLYTSTDPNELDARRLYEKHGFGLTGREPYPGTKIEKLYYELKL